MDKNLLISLIKQMVKTSPSSISQNKIMGYTEDEWDKKWKCIGPLKTVSLTPYNHSVGIYRHVINGKTMYIGRAVELNNGGFRKRLSDYRRPSNSARKHTSGRLIYEHLSEITTYILDAGSSPESVRAAKQLESAFVRRYDPPWNKMKNI